MIITSTYEELTKEEIAEIISDNFSRIKAVNESLSLQLATNSKKHSLRAGVRETARAMNEIINLAEDLGLELDE